MRYRRVKGATEKIERLREYLVAAPEEFKGKWSREAFGNEHPLFLEMGCGKGKFVTELARRHPECNFIGVEGQERVFLRAAQRAHEAGLKNVLFIGEFLRHPSDCFDRDEVSGLYLNFSDPWPKARHAKRRLTHHRYLEEYRRFLKPEGTVAFKTDNDDLFEFSVEEFRAFGARILELSWDLHRSPLKAKEVTTEYEEKFREWGKSIKYLKASLEQEADSFRLPAHSSHLKEG